MSNQTNLDEIQINAIQCAYLDLIGSYKVYDKESLYSHDWGLHYQTMREMLEAFPDILNDLDDIPEI